MAFIVRTFGSLMFPKNKVLIAACMPQSRNIKRWVSPTLRELKRRQKLLGPQGPEPRSSFVEWNYRAELFSFSKRLHEEFQLPLLQQAFTQRSYALKEQKKQEELGVEDKDIQLNDNTELAEHGAFIMREYVEGFISYCLPKLPLEGRKALADYLLTTSTLSNVASNLGMKELIFSAEYPPSEQSLAQSLKATIGALDRSSGAERAFLFVRDFICTDLNQRDLSEIWQIDNPEQMLEKVCKEQNLAKPEPRLIGDCGKNTVLAAYQVGIYCDRKLIGKGFGEDVSTAIKTASLDSLLSLFGIQDNMRPFNFDLKVERKTSESRQS